MKKSKLLLKSLIGIPIGIFALEVFNIFLSLKQGEYIRFDAIENNFTLNTVLTSYMYCSITSYLLMLYLNYTKNILNLDLPKKEERKANRKIYPVLIVIFIISSLATYSENIGDIIGVLVAFVWSGLVMLKISVETLLNKYSIKKINQRLKEIYKK